MVSPTVLSNTERVLAEHVSDDDLERYHLGMIRDEAELAPVEQHLLACLECVQRAEKSADYVDAMRGGSILVYFDLEQGTRMPRQPMQRRRPPRTSPLNRQGIPVPG